MLPELNNPLHLPRYYSEWARIGSFKFTERVSSGQKNYIKNYSYYKFTGLFPISHGSKVITAIELL